jgi:hypothetical protein
LPRVDTLNGTRQYERDSFRHAGGVFAFAFDSNHEAIVHIDEVENFGLAQ